MTDLDTAKRSMRAAAKRAEQTAAGTQIQDWSPVDDPELQARRDEAIGELNRPLSPNETFNLEAGLAYDFTPPPPPQQHERPLATRVGEHPEAALARQAAAIAEQEAQDGPQG